VVDATDYGQAHWLAGVLNQQYRYDHTSRKWHHWDPASGIWAFDQVEDLEEEIERHVDESIVAINDRAGEHYIKDEDERAETTKARAKLKMTINMSHALDALSTLSGYKTDGSEWDQDPYLLGCKNGVVDLRVNAFVSFPYTDNNGKEHSKGSELLVTRSTGHNFVPIIDWSEFKTRAPVLFKALMEWTSNDQALAMYFLLWFGYSLFGLSKEQRFLILTGIGRNGKGALVTAMRNVFGEYNAAANENLYMRSRFGGDRSSGPRADLMALKGKRLAIMSEPEGGAFNEEMLKAHTGGDPITARSLHSNNVISWRPTHSIVFLTNRAPKVDDVGPSMANRVMVADFREQFLGEREDRGLYDALTTESEAEGQLALLVFAAKTYHEQGLELPTRVIDASREYISSSDPVGRAIEEVFVIEKGARGPAQSMYAQYLEWHTQSNEEGEPMSGTAFGLALKRHGIDKKRVETGYVYIGIRPKGAMEIAMDEPDDDA
jgi:putative DNA primase/helicase